MTPARHGTRYRYVRYRCRCDQCRAANTAYMRIARKRFAQKGPARHGTDNGYRNYACRCDACTKAHTDNRRTYRRRKATT